MAVVVEVGEERARGALGEHPAEHGVDDRVEDDVVQGRLALVEPRVTQDHMVQLVHDEHDELLRRVGVRGHELRIHEEPRPCRALDRGGRDIGRFDDLGELQERRQPVGRGWEGVEQSVGDGGVQVHGVVVMG